MAQGKGGRGSALLSCTDVVLRPLTPASVQCPAHAGFSPIRQTSRAPSAKASRMKGELHPTKKPLMRRTSAPCAYFLACRMTASNTFICFMV